MEKKEEKDSSLSKEPSLGKKLREEKEEKKEEGKEDNVKEERIRGITSSYYSRQDIRKAIYEFSKNREVVPRYFEGFGKRPDALQYDSDILAFVKKGATSFHCSEEIWKDALQLSTELSEQELENLRVGWDLLIDIDSKYLDYSKISTQLLIQALEFHGVKNVGVKFSGSKGFHIIVPWKAFPKEVYGNETSKMFPEWPRLVCQYLNELIKKQLIEKISDLMQKDRKVYVKDFDSAEQVMPDIVLVSSRHLFRMPYSLHEKNSLASVVIDKNKVQEFQVKDANPLKVQVKDFYPEAEEEEARELLLQAIDWGKAREQTEEKEKSKRKKDFKEVIIKDLTPELFPPCISSVLNGIKQDGRKRALFILLNFFKTLKFDNEEIEKKIEEWNKKNYNPLKEGYIRSQLSWYNKQKSMLPPNCDKPHYKDLAVCKPDNFCKFVKNPVNYTIKKAFFRKEALGRKRVGK